MNRIPELDADQIARLNEWGGPELQRKMIHLFLTHAAERVDQIRDALHKENAAQAETGAHTLKSSAGNVGAQRVQRLAQDAETLAEAGDLQELSRLFPDLEAEFRAACDALQAVLEGIE